MTTRQTDGCSCPTRRKLPDHVDAIGKAPVRSAAFALAGDAFEGLPAQTEMTLPKLVQMIDPPNGHAFGFPKRFDGDVDALGRDGLAAWLLENGYPQEWIDLFPNGVPCRVTWKEASSECE